VTDERPTPPELTQLLAEIDGAERAARATLEAAATLAGFREAERQMLGKRSRLARLHQKLGQLPPELRKHAGEQINSAR
jgi:hypothetical protein